MPSILVIDDNPSVGTALDLLFSLHEIRCLRAETPQAGLDLLAREDVDLVIQDMNFHADTTSGDEGVALFHDIRQRHPDLPVILLTAWTQLESAIELVKAGAADYLAKPWDDRKLVATVNNLLELGESRRELAQANASERKRRDALLKDYDLRGIVFADPASENALALACQVARSDLPVLITGPNGAGKERYAEIVVAQGTTTIFWDPHELANVLGVAGVRYAVDASRGLPLRVICAAPSSVPSTPGLEMSGADFAGQEMETMLAWPEVGGVAEVMDMHGVLNGSERMLEILNAGLNSGKLIEGHARGLSGADLQAYLAAGVTSDHELTSGADALEKLRAGLTLEIRGSHPYLLPEIVAALKTLPHLSSQITVCTDDVPPDMLLEKGGIVALLNMLIEQGLPATDVLRMATLLRAA